MNIISAATDKNLFRDYFEPLESWQNWFVIYKALCGEKLSETEFEIYRQLTGATEQNFERVRELWICAGRRSGKSRSAAFLSVFLSLFFDWQKKVKRGDRPYFSIFSPNRDQGQIIMSYVLEHLSLNDLLKAQVEREYKESIELQNGLTIAIKTASWRSTRGFLARVVVLEECNFFRYELESAIRDKEIYRAVMPMLSTFQDSLLISISSPASPQGLMYEKFSKHWGKPGRVLCVRAPTLFLNPTFDRAEVEQAYLDDPEAARSEYGAEWRQGVSSLIDPERLQAVIDKAVIERPPVEGLEYHAFIDASSGRRDAFCLAISHVSEGKVVLDVCREWRPPFAPRAICEAYSEVLKKFKIFSAYADAFAGEWVRQGFAEFGIQIEKARMTKSDYYLSFLPIVNNGDCRILDQERLINQLLNLERRTRGGMRRDQVDVFAGHDDCANVCAGAIVEASQPAAEVGVWRI